MHKSKLQKYIEILCCLFSDVPMKLTKISHEVKLDKSSLGTYLSFLNDRRLVKKQNMGEYKNGYVVTERGLSMLKVIGPMVKEAHRIEIRNFEAISSALSGAILSSEKIEEKKSKWKISEYIREKRPKLKLSNLLKIEVAESEE